MPLYEIKCGWTKKVEMREQMEMDTNAEPSSRSRGCFYQCEVTNLEKNMTIVDFDPKRIDERETQKKEDREIMNLLGRFTAELLRDRIRETHPEPEWGDGETWRYYYIKECQRRGNRLLEQLDWPSHEDALYVNIHTGHVESLIGIATTYGNFADRHSVASEVWSIVEHWDPYDGSKPNP